VFRSSLVVAAGTACALLASTLGPAPDAVASNVEHATMVSEVPLTSTPEVKNGRVQALAQVGDVIVLGGTFTKVSDRGGAAVARSAVAAYDRRTGRLLPDFAPVINGQVWALLEGPFPGTVYVGGAFTTVNGEKALRLVLLDLATGQRVSRFRPVTINGPVKTLARVGDRLYIGGVFTRVGGRAHAGLASLHARFGKLDPYVNNQFSQNHNWGRVAGAAKSPVGVIDLAITPDGTQMTAIGNFRVVDRLVRDQVVVIDLTTSQSTVRTDWSTSHFTAPCYSRSFDHWVRDVDYSPDGSYFVVGSTGGGNRDLCDAIGRFSTTERGNNIQPTWIASTGGDSIYSLAATGSAIYAGGHFRWFNNPNAVDKAGPGAVPRPGIAAIDPATGMTLDWNPGRHPRDKGAFVLLATDLELVVGSDTQWVGNKEYFTPRLASFPLSGGRALPDTETPGIPGTLNRIVPTGSGASSIVRHDVSADSVGAASEPIAEMGLQSVRGAVAVGGWIYLATSDGFLHRRSYDGGPMGANEVLDPYNDPEWSTVLTGLRSGTETYRGLPSGFERDMATMTSLFYLNERLYYTVSGSSELRSRVFEAGTGATHPQVTVISGVSMPQITGATYADGHLYYVRASDGVLVRHGFDGTALLGTPTAVSGPAIDGIDWRSQAIFVGPAA
jgi:hypothetical protein